MNSPNPQSNPLLINGGGRLTPEGDFFTPATGQTFLVPAPVCPQEEYNPAITIPDMIRALVEVKRICRERAGCIGCPFNDSRKAFCRIAAIPHLWDIDDWKEDSDETD